MLGKTTQRAVAMLGMTTERAVAKLTAMPGER